MSVDLACALCGALAGVLAGMLGIGGGLVILPCLVALAPALRIDPQLLPQTVVATSLAAMIPTTLAAAWSQKCRGTVDVNWTRRFVPGVTVGITSTALIVGNLKSPWVLAAFSLYAFCCGAHMLLRPAWAAGVGRPSPATAHASRGPRSVHLAATALGAASAAAGLGGAFISVPYLLRQGMPLRQVLATSSAISALVCIEGCIAYTVLTPRGAYGVPVAWQAAAIIGAIAAMTAPLGVAFSRRIPVVGLRRLFGVVAIIAALSALRTV